MRLDRVWVVGVASLVVLGLQLGYVIHHAPLWLTTPLSRFMLIWVGLAVLAGGVYGFFINPMVAYKRNAEVCVGGLPFPMHYGMPVAGGCLSGYFNPWCFFLDLAYALAFFGLSALTVFINGTLVGNLGFLGTVWVYGALIRWLVRDYLKVYPIRFEAEG
ncbi:hypothetical protein [Ferrimonas balearica]|uniref:hypothetical protein n=1 Tax=Ferrimonas balearica TaxID=44012 RepID=UPI001C996BE7|nr:hypothetical protein [Ferrimonas balearica]MBY5993148.1 hypothetical protein [Ferrimonas balearica]